MGLPFFDTYSSNPEYDENYKRYYYFLILFGAIVIALLIFGLSDAETSSSGFEACVVFLIIYIILAMSIWAFKKRNGEKETQRMILWDIGTEGSPSVTGKEWIKIALLFLLSPAFFLIESVNSAIIGWKILFGSDEEAESALKNISMPEWLKKQKQKLSLKLKVDFDGADKFSYFFNYFSYYKGWNIFDEGTKNIRKEVFLSTIALGIIFSTSSIITVVRGEDFVESNFVKNLSPSIAAVTAAVIIFVYGTLNGYKDLPGSKVPTRERGVGGVKVGTFNKENLRKLTKTLLQGSGKSSGEGSGKSSGEGSGKSSGEGSESSGEGSGKSDDFPFEQASAFSGKSSGEGSESSG